MVFHHLLSEKQSYVPFRFGYINSFLEVIAESLMKENSASVDY